jgi:hypothetical protein
MAQIAENNLLCDLGVVGLPFAFPLHHERLTGLLLPGLMKLLLLRFSCAQAHFQN